MKTTGRLTMLLALLGGLAIGSVLLLSRREGRRIEDKRERKQGLHDWEGEGGSLAPTVAPASAS